jgi:hypothetical protein
MMGWCNKIWWKEISLVAVLIAELGGGTYLMLDAYRMIVGGQ